ncbi:asparagine synthetase B [Inhella sp.]|uniref:asparagine synthetase B family protein n=1 Tax=Inhella sp. TaxID=1921806 RepID=UPI0035AD77C1
MSQENSRLVGRPFWLSDPERRPLALTELQAAWQAHGAAFLADLGGAFALELRQPGKALLAVDRMARHTLCWLQNGGQLLVAEQASALGQADALDPQALFNYLYFHCIPAPQTVFQGVQRLPAGHALLWEGQRAQVVPYWTASFAPNPQPDFAALKQEFRGLLEQGVRTELQGGVPACFLSGGTDSSTVAGLVQQLTGRCEAFSIGFEAEGYDEMVFAKAAAEHFDVSHHAYYVTPKDLLQALPQVAAHFDQPFGNSSSLPSFFCARMARQAGADKVLAGDGGDELFGGNSRYAQGRLFAHYARVPHWVRRGLLEPLFENDLMRRVPGLKKGSSYITQAKAGMPARLEMYNLIHRLGLKQVLTEPLLAQVDCHAPQALQQAVWDQVRAANELNTQLAFDWRFTLAENDLVKVRGACGMAEIGVGFPLLDDALLAFSSRLPLDYKLRGERLRWFFKEALADFLPQAVITKSKHGFGLPFGPWLAHDPALQALARDTMHSLAGRGLLQASFIDRLLREYLPQHPGYYGEMVWIALSLELWLQAHAPNYRL